MRFSKDNVKDVEFIENWYQDIERGFKGVGKTYVRPIDWLDRAIRVMNESVPRDKIKNQIEGKRSRSTPEI